MPVVRTRKLYICDVIVEPSLLIAANTISSTPKQSQHILTLAQLWVTLLLIVSEATEGNGIDQLTSVALVDVFATELINLHRKMFSFFVYSCTLLLLPIDSLVCRHICKSRRC